MMRQACGAELAVNPAASLQALTNIREAPQAGTGEDLLEKMEQRKSS